MPKNPHSLDAPATRSNHATWIDLIRERAQERPHQIAFTFLGDGEVELASITYRDLDRKARTVAASLYQAGATGERVLLLYPAGLDFIIAFLGCLYSGSVAVPSYPPQRRRLLSRLASIARDCRPAVVLTQSAIVAQADTLNAASTDLAAATWLATDTLDEAQAEAWSSPTLNGKPLNGEALAFLQYTSGSTGSPKGVMVSHRNLLHNESMIHQAFDLTESSVVVGWLPLYHDMGLIGTVLQPLYLGGQCVIMSPTAFLQKPARWLEAISSYGAEASGGPNFAFELCVRRISEDQKRQLDLSQWTVAFNGAEPIRAATLDRFAEAFASCGFRREAFFPCYGLAEATLFVTGGAADKAPEPRTFDSSELRQDRAVPIDNTLIDKTVLVDSGHSWCDQELKIVDPEGLQPLADRRVGEIWVRGPSVAQGYFEQPDATMRDFGAELDGVGGYLRTGDLGFLDNDQLFVTGRLKELIILRGRNLYPHDLELTAETSHPALRPGASASFSADFDGEECLVMALEVDRRVQTSINEALVEDVAAKIRMAVTTVHQARLESMVLIPTGSLLKTSSGKIRRRAVREAWLSGKLPMLAESRLGEAPSVHPPSEDPDDGGRRVPAKDWRKTGETKDYPASFTRQDLLSTKAEVREGLLLDFLRNVAARAIRLPADSVPIDRPLTSLGLDSLSAVEIHGQISDRLGVAPDVVQLLDGMSLAELCQQTLVGLELPLVAAPIPARSSATNKIPHEVDGLQPLSSGQEALWFLHQVAPKSAAYHIAGAARLRGQLDTAALGRTFERLVERHPVLHTRFIDLGGHLLDGNPTGGRTAGDHLVDNPLVQEVLPAGTCGIDYRVERAEDWDTNRLRQRLIAEVRQPFDLTQLPLMRALVLQRGEGDDGQSEHILHLVVHHIVADFWSIAVLLDELGEIYAGETSGHSIELAPPSLQYVDWVRWQREHLAGPEGASLRDYWLETLAGDLQPIDLATDHPRPPVQTFDGSSRQRHLDPALSARLKAHAARSGATLYATLLAGYQALLHRLTGQRDILVGSPDAGRSRPELAGLVGYFVNSLVLRGKLDGDQPWAAHLEQTRRTALDAFRHRDYPFDALVKRLQPQRSASRPPVFQVFFTMHQPPRYRVDGLQAFALGSVETQIELGGLTWQPIETPNPTAQFELALTAAEHGDELMLAMTYNHALFEASTIDRWLSHLHQLLTGALDNPARPVADLPLLTAAERWQMLTAWNAGPRIEPIADLASESQPLCVHQLVLEQAKQMPDAVAVVFKGRAVSYRELVESASRLADHLRDLGIGPDVPVGLCVERCPEMIEGVLGILMAGGAYVPLDPSYPQERLIYSLGDALASGADRPAPRLLVTRQQDRKRLGDLEQIVDRVVDINNFDPIEPGAQTSLASRPAASATNLAYVIYTSGSTGKPKGVQIEHRTLTNFLESMRHQPGLAADDVLIAVTTLAFDIAALEIFLPLIVGARVVVLPRDVVANGSYLIHELEACGATAMQATPATWRLLLESGWRGQPNLKMLCGGEALPSDLATQLQPLGAELWNMYGPTETTIWSAARKVVFDEDPVRLGGPIFGTRLHVFDTHLAPVPVGIPGELWIAGDGLARGYRGRPALTAERFLPDPLAGECGPKGGRLYRVGDLARFRANGELEFLGREDHQVKVRGYRIELGEIEAVLNDHPRVAQAVVGVVDNTTDPRLVAWYVPTTDVAAAEPALSAGELRDLLRRTLPEYMLPSRFIVRDELPLTPNGKVDRSALRHSAPRTSSSTASRMPKSKLERELTTLWCEVLQIDDNPDDNPSVAVDLDDNFFDLGGHSLLVTRLHRLLQERLSLDVSIVDLFQYPTVGSLASYLVSKHSESGIAPESAPETGTTVPSPNHDVAIIGMAGRFPGANNVAELWRNVRDGVESISFFDDEELSGHVPEELLTDPRYVRARGVLDGAEEFDADFFGLSPREAEVMDPQHRLFLECAQDALDDAGYDPSRHRGKIGLFAGVGMNSYLLHVGEQQLAAVAGSYQAFISNDKDFVPTRVSYKLDLRGPSVNVQTACSSSLVAVHMACQSLATGESNIALAGGVSVRVPQIQGYIHEPGSILSPDGHCRAFDAEAGGTVLGNGTGIVVLKPLAAAQADGDRVLAVIKGSAINNDGAQKIGYTAPSVEGQTEVIRSAHAAAGVKPASISYIEAHGTGTELGDPIEVAALIQAFGASSDPTTNCSLGSVKTNIGHLDTAAGIAGLIKTVQALRHAELPPSLHFESPNPRISLANSPFRVQQACESWSRNGEPRRAAVSSFGIGGTNAHIVLEEAPALEEATSLSKPWRLLLVSARTPKALEAVTDRLVERLRAPDTSSAGQPGTLPDIAYTLQVGRRFFDHRRWLVADSRKSAADALASRDPAVMRTVANDKTGRRVVMLFSGQGSQYVDMGRQLYDTEPVFRRQLDDCAERLTPELGIDLRHVLYPDPSEDNQATLDSRLRDTRLAQPALFALEVALARQWMAWGVTPSAMLGHSIGELVAATLAGVFTLDDALHLVAIRGRLMAEQPAGAMLGVAMAERDLLPHLGDNVQLAAVNGRTDCVVSGTTDAIAALARQLAESAPEARCQPLHTSHAFHSAMMRPAIRPWVEKLELLELKPPRIPFVSNLTGTWISDTQATDPEYWGRHLAEPVRFADGITTLAQEPAVFLEVGPGHTLANLVRSAARSRQQTVLAISTLPHPKNRHNTQRHLTNTLGQLWQAGGEIDWLQVYDQRQERRRRVELPSYPYERQRFWLDPEPKTQQRGAASSVQSNDDVDRLQKKADVGEWIAYPLWKPALREPADEMANGSPSGSLLLVTSELALGQQLTARLSHQVGHVQLLDPGNELVGLLPFKDHLSGIATPETGSARVRMLTRYAFRVEAGDPVEPAQALLWGFAQTLAQEHRELDVRCIDVDTDLDVDQVTDEDLDEWVAELVAPASSTAGAVAFRAGRRTQRVFEPLRLPSSNIGRADNNLPPRLLSRGPWLITGGGGGVGQVLATTLAKAVPTARFVLLSRHASHQAAKHLEALGAEVEVATADVADPETLSQVLANARQRFGPLRGVIHAAGVAGGGILATRQPTDAAAILRPKVAGTRGLFEALADDPLDFAILCSSINSVVGGYGQGDYAAANAFVDAFAEQLAVDTRRRDGRSPLVVALGWDRWRDVGMAKETPLGATHPLLGIPVLRTSQRVIYRSVMAPETHWILAEHEVAGHPTVPGASYLEMARAAWSGHVGSANATVDPNDPVEIRDAVFLEPLVVDHGTRREVLTILDLADGRARFQILSRALGTDSSAWREHSRGSVGTVAAVPRRIFDTAELASGMATHITAEQAAERSSLEFLVTGQRWQGLVSVRHENLPSLHATHEDRHGELLIELGLPEDVAKDLVELPLHPALLDIAVGCVQLVRQGNFLPLSYQRLTLHAPLPSQLWSYLKLRGEGDTLICDAALVDHHGSMCAEIEGFAMQKVSAKALASLEQPTKSEEIRNTYGGPEDLVLSGLIEPNEAAEILLRLLASQRPPPHLVVSPHNFDAVREAYRDFDPTALTTGLGELASAPPGGSRDTLGTTFVAPTGGLEQVIAETWQRYLGIESIGINDNFFELGGTSLLGVQVIGELQRRLEREIPTVSLFEAPTIAALTEYLEPTAEDPQTTVQAQLRASKKKAALDTRRAARGRRARPYRRTTLG